MSVSNPPRGYHSICPYLLITDVPKMIDFLVRAFGAIEKERHERPDGSIGHAEVKIGDSIVMMGGVSGEWKSMEASVFIYIDDADAAYARALAAGATSVMEPSLQYYGDRMGGVRDPFGNLWWVATHVEDVSPEEMAARSRAQQQRA